MRAARAEHAPGRPGIAPVYKFEEAVDDDSLFVNIQGLQDEEFRKLIHPKDCQGQNGYPPGGIEFGHLTSSRMLQIMSAPVLLFNR